VTSIRLYHGATELTPCRLERSAGNCRHGQYRRPPQKPNGAEASTFALGKECASTRDCSPPQECARHDGFAGPEPSRCEIGATRLQVQLHREGTIRASRGLALFEQLRIVRGVGVVGAVQSDQGAVTSNLDGRKSVADGRKLAAGLSSGRHQRGGHRALPVERRHRVSRCRSPRRSPSLPRRGRRAAAQLAACRSG
jgi:hypothetical protein